MIGEDDTHKTKAAFLFGGALAGAVVGHFLGTMFLGSSVGIGVGVLAATRYLDQNSLDD